MHLIARHLEQLEAYSCVLFIDYISASSTIQPPILHHEMQLTEINPTLIRWYHSFLTNKTASQGQQLTLRSRGHKHQCPTVICEFTVFVHLVHKRLCATPPQQHSYQVL